MSTIKMPLKRITIAMIVLILALAVAVPHNATVYAAAAVNDDFNRCSLDTTVWTFENPAGFPNTSIVGKYEGDSNLQLTIPAGRQASFSSTNRDAPRIMQPITDVSQAVEVKFNSALGVPPAGAWTIQGVLVRDSQSVPGKSRWLRFELDANGTSINYYVGYIDENNVLHKVSGPNVIAGVDGMNMSPDFLRVRYEKDTNSWSVGYRLGNSGTLPYRTTVAESAIPGLSGDFVPTHIGVFAGQTGSNLPGFTAQVDYIKIVGATIAEDANIITVTKAGTGTGSVNWPMTSGSQCSGNRVSLTATAAAGSRFTGWTGDASGSNATIQLTMTQPYAIVANFSGGAPVDQPYKYFGPYINRK